MNSTTTVADELYNVYHRLWQADNHRDVVFGYKEVKWIAVIYKDKL